MEDGNKEAAMKCDIKITQKRQKYAKMCSHNRNSSNL